MLKICVLLPYLVFLTCLKEGYSSDKNIRVKRNTVTIVDGDKSCITNCSRMSSENNVFMQCSINECGVLETSSTTSQPSEILKPRKDIYLEKYNDGGEDRLALYVKWSPVDNVSLKDTKGYQINITDGNSHYSICYYFNTPMVFANNAHDSYYNDCFGKASGTRIMPDSEIVISITNLPLWVANRNDGTQTATIEVPDCNNEKLHSLPECQTPGGRPTTQLCVSETCDTSSLMNGQEHHVSCSISKFEFGQAGPERCVEVNRTVAGSVSQPLHIPRPQEWYKYIDPNTKEVKVALNFSWMPSRDSSIESLKYYYLEIMLASGHSLANFDTCYSIHTQLSQKRHGNVSFYYDCYGRVDHTRNHPVKPGSTYQVHLESRPGSLRDSSTRFVIEIPKCDSPAMMDVAGCEGKPHGDVKLKVVEKFCQNFSVKVNYSLLEGSKSKARIYVCSTGMGLEYCGDLINDYANYQIEYPYDEPCFCRDLYLEATYDGPSGTLYASVPSSTNIHQNLSIFLHSMDNHFVRVVEFFDFSKCVKAPPNRAWLYIMIVISCTLCVIALLSLVCYFHQGRCALKSFITSVCRQERIDDPPADPPSIRVVGGCIEEDGMVMPDNVRVYVVFTDDHPLHKEVIHWFCSFLKQDLGLDVRLNIWEEGQVATNQNKYMMTQVANADKVIIICSAGTEGCLDRQYSGDMISPVIRQACNQTFIGKEPGKFMVGYFPYSKPEHIPEMLHDQCKMYFSAFKLMKQFEQFYFRIVGVEQFQEGGIQRIEKIAFDRYFDPKLTSCGQRLKSSIETMIGFNRENRTWYTDKFGSDLPIANIPPAPSESKDGSQPVHGDGNASIAHIESNPPPGFPTHFPQKPQNVDKPMSAVVYRPVQPANHYPAKGKVGDYQKLSSVTSTDSSFILTDPEHTSPTTPDTPGSPPYPKRSRHQPKLQRNSSGDSPQSFHPASFNDDDFPAGDSIDSSLNSQLLHSNVTQITRLGLTESQEQLATQTQTNLLGDPPVFDDIIFDDQAPAGPLTLANLDDNIVDIEDTFRTINFDSSDYQNSSV